MPHLLFDLDGTLTDPAEGIVGCYRHTAEAFGRVIEGDPRRFIGPPLHDNVREILGTDDAELVEKAVGVYRARFAEKGMFENVLIPGVVDVLGELHAAGHELRVATSKYEPFADRIVDHFGLRAFFPRVYGPDVSGARGDKKALIAHILEVEGIDPRAAVMIGDRAHDILGAAHHGMRAIGVLWGFGTAEELREAGAAHVVERPDELVDAVRRTSNG